MAFYAKAHGPRDHTFDLMLRSRTLLGASRDSLGTLAFLGTAQGRSPLLEVDNNVLGSQCFIQLW
jgi:hypothetical protein